MGVDRRDRMKLRGKQTRQRLVQKQTDSSAEEGEGEAAESTGDREMLRRRGPKEAGAWRRGVEESMEAESMKAESMGGGSVGDESFNEDGGQGELDDMGLEGMEELLALLKTQRDDEKQKEDVSAHSFTSTCLPHPIASLGLLWIL